MEWRHTWCSLPRSRDETARASVASTRRFRGLEGSHDVGSPPARPLVIEPRAMRSHDSSPFTSHAPTSLPVQLAGWILFGLILLAGWRLTDRSQGGLYDSHAVAREIAKRGDLG